MKRGVWTGIGERVNEIISNAKCPMEINIDIHIDDKSHPSIHYVVDEMVGRYETVEYVEGGNHAE